jgi:hypothetical protein
LQSIVIPKGKRDYFEQLLKEYHNDDLIPYLKEV